MKIANNNELVVRPGRQATISRSHMCHSMENLLSQPFYFGARLNWWLYARLSNSIVLNFCWFLLPRKTDAHLKNQSEDALEAKIVAGTRESDHYLFLPLEVKAISCRIMNIKNICLCLFLLFCFSTYKPRLYLQYIRYANCCFKYWLFNPFLNM